VPDGHHWKNSVDLLPPGVDTRTSGAFILLAPSVVGDNPCHWLRPLVSKAELPPRPGWLVEALDDLGGRQGLSSGNGRRPSTRLWLQSDSLRLARLKYHLAATTGGTARSVNMACKPERQKPHLSKHPARIGKG